MVRDLLRAEQNQRRLDAGALLPSGWAMRRAELVAKLLAVRRGRRVSLSIACRDYSARAPRQHGKVIPT